MAERVGTITSDGLSEPIQIGGSNCHIAFKGTFASAVISIKHIISGKTFNLFDEGVAIQIMAEDDSQYALFTKDTIQFDTASATGSTDITYQVTWE